MLAVLAVIASGLLGTVALASQAAADDPPGGSDGTCRTRPTWYPNDGEPVPEGADCHLVYSDGSSQMRAELWSWRETDSATWYNFPVDGAQFDPGTALVMCATFDEHQAEYLRGCSPNSGYLLFTTGSPYATVPLNRAGDVYFCETLTVVWPANETARACGVAIDIGDGSTPTPTEPVPTSVTPTGSNTPDTPTPSATSATQHPASPPPTSDQPTSDGPTQPPAEPTHTDAVAPTTAGPPVTTSAAPVTSAPSDAGAIEGRPPPQIGAAAPESTVSVAHVSDSRFPTAVVIGLALVLAAGGVGILVLPALRDLRRSG